MRRRCVLLVVALMSLWACNKENTEFAKVLLEDDLAKVKPVPQIDIFGTTELDSEANTNKLDSAFVGTYIDHLYGTTSSACAMQLRILGNSFVSREDGDNFVIDSVCMSVRFDLKRSIYDSLTFSKTNKKLPKQRVKVFSLAKSIAAITKSSQIDDSFEKTNILKGDVAELDYTSPVKVTHVSRYYDKSDNKDGEIVVDGVMRMNLTEEFGGVLLGLDSLDYESQHAFLQKINGVVIAPESDSSGDGLFSFNPITTLITVHYRKGPENKQDTLFVPFVVTSNSVVVAKYEQAHSAIINTAVNESLTDKIYVQGGAGLKANILLPQGLIDTSFNKPKRVINKAELKINVSDDNFVDSEGNKVNPKIAHVPFNLVMMGYDVNGNIVKLPDYMISRSLAGATYDSDDKSYTFNIIYLLQEMANSVDEEEFLENTKIDLSKGFAIYPDYRRKNPRRVVLDGESMKLNITYTEL